tara:strand:+ start:498 stop:1091 length:594 start_codon:yes stop_codon:yes gene_type:complete
MPTPNPDPSVELSPCRTYYSPTYIPAENYADPANRPNDEFTHTISLTLENQSEVAGNIRETITASSYTTTDSEDSGTSIVDNGDHTYTYSGIYTIESFPNISMTFRTDFTNNTNKTITGWPPSDARAKDMHSVSLDPRTERTYDITITWTVQTETYSGTEWTVTNSGTNHSYIWRKDAGNKIGHYFSTLLGNYLNGS